MSWMDFWGLVLCKFIMGSEENVLCGNRSFCNFSTCAAGMIQFNCRWVLCWCPIRFFFSRVGSQSSRLFFLVKGWAQHLLVFPKHFQLHNCGRVKCYFVSSHALRVVEILLPQYFIFIFWGLSSFSSVEDGQIKVLTRYSLWIGKDIFLVKPDPSLCNE